MLDGEVWRCTGKSRESSGVGVSPSKRHRRAVQAPGASGIQEQTATPPPQYMDLGTYRVTGHARQPRPFRDSYAPSHARFKAASCIWYWLKQNIDFFYLIWQSCGIMMPPVSTSTHVPASASLQIPSTCADIAPAPPPAPVSRLPTAPRVVPVLSRKRPSVLE